VKAGIQISGIRREMTILFHVQGAIFRIHFIINQDPSSWTCFRILWWGMKSFLCKFRCRNLTKIPKRVRN